MTPVIAAVLGAVGGVVIGLVPFWLSRRRVFQSSAQAERADSCLADVVDVLKAQVVVLDEDDAVVVSSRTARGTGLVRGTKVNSPALLEVIAEVRAEGHDRIVEVAVSRGPQLPAALLELNVELLPDDVVLVTGEDRTADQRFSDTRRDFVANVTHELKTPIGAISLLAEAISAAADDPDGIRMFVDRLSAETQRLNELVSQIITLSRLQAEDPMLAADPVRLDDLVSGAIRRCRSQADHSDISVTASGTPQLWALGDAAQLEGAVTNLVQNAISYSEPGARVAITTRRDGDDVEIRVSDNGIGISEADLERVFERFYRVDYGRSRAHGGTGLGLSIVKHVAAAHGGEVTAWSRLGSGSTFTIRLPEYHAPHRTPSEQGGSL